MGQANPAGGAPVLKLLTDLTALKTSLTAARAAVTVETVNRSIKREQVRDLMTAVLGRFNQFTALVRSRYAEKAFARSLLGAPSVGDAPDTFLQAAEKAESHWIAINATLGALPLTLGAGTVPNPAYPVATFTTDLAALRSAAQAIRTSEQKLRTLIKTRNDIQSVIAPLLRDYRQAVAGRFAEGHAFVESLPRFSPLPGNKPDKPELTSALWNATTGLADITFTPSTSDNVVRHELRICAGSEYDADLETIDGSLAAGQPPEFHTASLLGSPGAIISIRIYAITGDDQENDSQALSVQRPAA